eukprot:gb/GECH01003011.1/.p1 GENE.gb/GECH01003011.1/~~gb/GECH01003011.1/.p1  ORF type:complete len:377 (+),score=122.20 gb/GECH01003011.1/:1-1131(+)
MLSCKRCRQTINVSFDSGPVQRILDSYIDLQESPEQKKQNKEHEESVNRWTNVELTSALYDYARKKVQVDHPLCEECTEHITHILTKQLEELEFENQSYEDFLQELQEAEKNTDESKYQEEIKQLEEQEQSLREELHQVFQELQEVEKDQQEVNDEKQKLDELEQRYWHEYNSFQVQLQTYKEDRDALSQRKSQVEEELKLLSSTNVYNDVFHIWYDGHFGTINKFRLGKVPAQQVEWSEINAAWGHAALLLATIARKKNFRFSTYQINPMGSFSTVEKLGTNQKHELYGGGANSGFFWQSRFDKAMVGFLTCLKEIGEEAEKRDSSFKLPYSIEGEKIGGLSIKYNNSSEEKWTRSLKYMLTNLKWLLSWVAKSS